MWIEFLKDPFAHWIDEANGRRLYGYFKGDKQDLAEGLACMFVAKGEAVPCDPPPQFAPIEPWIPKSLGDDPLTIACVHRSGGGVYDGRDYVQRLSRGVARNLRGVDYRFACLTDQLLDEPGIERIPLTENWPGFWSKVELYRPGLFHGPVLYFDLDTIICGDLAPLATLRAAAPVVAASDTQWGWMNSSLLRFDADLSFIFDKMAADPEAMIRRYQREVDNREVNPSMLWGDQGLLQDTLREHAVPWVWAQQALPETIAWIPPAARTPNTSVPAGTAITMWYGDPKPHAVDTPWVRENWA